MNVWPVMHRELRAEARHAFNYWLRVLGASVLLAVFAVMMLDPRDHGPELGAKLFGNLNTALFVAIWVLAPLLTADCISRERREGTLGLLFLTPLTSRGIVIGKGLIHTLRATTMVFAADAVAGKARTANTARSGSSSHAFVLASVRPVVATGRLALPLPLSQNHPALAASMRPFNFLVNRGTIVEWGCPRAKPRKR